jgi:hypothetical protein
MESESFSIKVYFADEFQRNYRLRLFFLSPTTMQQTHHQRNFAPGESLPEFLRVSPAQSLSASNW